MCDKLFIKLCSSVTFYHNMNVCIYNAVYRHSVWWGDGKLLEKTQEAQMRMRKHASAHSHTHTHKYTHTRWRTTAAVADCPQQKGRVRTSPGLCETVFPLCQETWAARAASDGLFNGSLCFFSDVPVSPPPSEAGRFLQTGKVRTPVVLA